MREGDVQRREGGDVGQSAGVLRGADVAGGCAGRGGVFHAEEEDGVFGQLVAEALEVGGGPAGPAGGDACDELEALRVVGGFEVRAQVGVEDVVVGGRGGEGGEEVGAVGVIGEGFLGGAEERGWDGLDRGGVVVGVGQVGEVVDCRWGEGREGVRSGVGEVELVGMRGGRGLRGKRRWRVWPGDGVGRCGWRVE